MWPVVPADTCSYVGFAVRPPVYPEVVETTPSSLSNGGSMHQKQPPAKVARASSCASAAPTAARQMRPATIPRMAQARRKVTATPFMQ